MSLDQEHDKVTIRTRPELGGDPWVVWVPPTGPESYEGDALVGPYGDSYWPTWNEAAGFAVLVVQTLRTDQEPQP